MGSLNLPPLGTLILYHVFLGIILGCIDASPNSQESDRVINLPGQPNSPSISQFSGYITVNEDNGRALFYWFIEAQSEPSEKPLLLWLSGGPGCSSVGSGGALLLGPLLTKKNGVEYNGHSWYKEANLLFVDSPVGTGFSYSNTSSDLYKLDDSFTAEDAYSFLVNWVERFPHFRNRDFYIAGESYSGHYVPQLAELVFDRNNDTTRNLLLNLKGFMAGNPTTDDYYDYKGFLDYAWGHAVISDEVYENAKQICDFEAAVSQPSPECKEVVYQVVDMYNDIDVYDIYAPKCLQNITTSSADGNAQKNGYGFRRMGVIPEGYDPCYYIYAIDYFNREDVQIAFRANRQTGWLVCSEFLYEVYNVTVLTVLPIYEKLIKGGLKIWVYSGDVDGLVPIIGTKYWVEALKLPIKSPWRSWFHNHQVGGRLVEYEGLTLVTVRGGGHLVPLTKPSEALALFHSFVTGEILPAQR